MFLYFLLSCIILLVGIPVEAYEENYECFDPPTLNGDKNSFLHFDILDEENVQVSWRELWKETDWSLCFDEVQIVANLDREDEMAVLIMDPYIQKSLNVSVVPCIENTYVLKAIHEPTGEAVISLGKARPIVTIRSLSLLPTPSNGIQRSFQTDSDKIIYFINPKDIFVRGDCVTRRSFTLYTRLHGEGDWTPSVVEHSENEAEIYLYLELASLKNIDKCRYYDVKLNVNEQGHEVEMDLDSIYPFGIKETKSLNDSIGAPDPPSVIEQIDSDTTSVKIAWDESNIACSTAFILSFIDFVREDEKIPHGDGGTYLITDLEPCSKYEISIKTEFESTTSEKGTSFFLTTRPIISNIFELQYINISISKASEVQFSWDSSEYPCLKADDYNVHVSNVYSDDEDREYFSIQDGKLLSSGQISFLAKGLKNCTDYTLAIASPELGDVVPVEKKFRTGGTKNKVLGIQVTNSTATTITLIWNEDPCAKGYQVSHSRIVMKHQEQKSGFDDEEEYFGEGSGIESSGFEADTYHDSDALSGSGWYNGEYQSTPGFDFKVGRMVFENTITIRTLEPCNKYFINVKGYYAESKLGNKDSDYGPSSIIEHEVLCPSSMKDYVSTTIKNVEELLAGNFLDQKTNPPPHDTSSDFFLEDEENVSSTIMPLISSNGLLEESTTNPEIASTTDIEIASTTLSYDMSTPFVETSTSYLDTTTTGEDTTSTTNEDITSQSMDSTTEIYDISTTESNTMNYFTDSTHGFMSTTQSLSTTMDDLMSTTQSLSTITDELMSTTQFLYTTTDELMSTTQSLSTTTDELMPTTQSSTTTDELMSTTQSLSTTTDELMSTANDFMSTTESSTVTTDFFTSTTDTPSTTHMPTMSTDFTSTTIDASTTTTLDYQTTTTYVPTTILPLIPIQNVIYNISESNDKDFPLTLSIHWAQAKTVTSDLRLNKQMISSHDTTHNSETDYNTIHTNTEVDHCKEYSLDIVDNETGEIYWEDKAITPFNQNRPLDFKKFSMNESNGQVEWENKEYFINCLTGFAIIFNDKSRTEVPLNVTSISLIEKQPELSLCDHVDLKFIPMNHEQTYDNAEYSAKFQYIPKVKTEIYSITNHNMFIKFGNDIGCEPVKLSWTNLKSQDVLSSEVSMPQFEIKDLDSCTEYKILITSEKNSNVLFDQTIKSLVGEHAPMEDHEVNVLINNESIVISWMDQCQLEYVFETCLTPLDCSLMSNYKALTTNTTELTLNKLEPCRTYMYNIKTEGLLLYNGSFSTEPTSDIQVDSSFFDFQLSKDEISIKWTGIWPCIKEYRVQLLEDGDPNEKPIFSKDILSSSNMSFYLEISKDLTLINCNSYTFQISTILFDPSSLVLFSKSFKYSNGFFPPIQGLDYSRLGPDFLFEWKKPEYCGLKYYIAEILDQDLNVIYKSLNATESLHLNTSNMMPCSEFQLKLSYIGDGESDTESESSSLKFHTLHSENIPINVKEDFNQIEFSIGPINGSGHCVDYYVLTLCRFDSGSCQEKTIRAESVIQSPSKIVIDGLSSKTSYLYQVTGFNQEGMKVFYDSDHQIDTKSFIKTANLRLLLAKENKIILELKSSLFKDHMDPEYSFIANCIEEESDESFRQSIKSKPKLVFYDLPMASKFTCGGEVIYQNEVYSFHPPLEISTLEGIPSEPLNIASQNVTPTGASIKWSPPSITNGKIGEYLLTIRIICDSTELFGHCLNECFNLIEDKEYSSNTNSIVLKDLLPHREYSVKISARTTTRNEFSIWSKVYVFRTAPGNPFVPEIVSVKGVSSSKIIVDFDYPCLTSGITRFDVFVTKSITLKKKYHRTLKKRIEVGRKRFIVEGLEGGHNYDVQISARVENCYSKQCLKKE
ncbi:uncharacterized protein [Lepeophtheirus salmonis]|uniref:uncharacterized protein isoform X1 n=2 Tax=Lepeophtheirus salmonis TaxID=72036 RepID=UPI001AE371FB|nr:uncharacterized protein LOC121126406 [Lepeophtheirus salmonis]XP_040577674.1 uncharacterized protein LOC121126406 [Lepeophtheirus salmonis]